jgi:uncharacterized protein (DUF736 family)
MIIGRFNPPEDHTSYGWMISPAGTRMEVSMRGADPRGDKTPDFYIDVDDFEFGAVWKRTSREGKPYLSVKLDSPFLPAPINCALMPEEGGSYIIVWNRDERKQP